MLAERGFRVVRFDNRDIGHSTMLDGGGRAEPRSTCCSAAADRAPTCCPTWPPTRSG